MSFWCRHDDKLIDKHETESPFDRMAKADVTNIKSSNRYISFRTLIYTFKCGRCGRVKQKVHKV